MTSSPRSTSRQDRRRPATRSIDVNAHIRLASPEQNGGIRLLRRGYNYTDGQDPDTGKLAAGLFFIAFQRDPQAQFKVLQTRLGQVRPAQRVHRAHRRRPVGLPPGLSGPATGSARPCSPIDPGDGSADREAQNSVRPSGRAVPSAAASPGRTANAAVAVGVT